MKTITEQYAIVTAFRETNETASYTVTWTNLGPLTTTFTPAPACASPLPTNLVVRISTAWRYDCSRIEASDTPRSLCYPSHEPTKVSTQLPANNLPVEHRYFYSPGYACPAEWHAATSFTTPAPSILGAWGAERGPLGLQANGTQIICCPNSWTLGGFVQCISSLSTRHTGSYCIPSSDRTVSYTYRPTWTSYTQIAYTTPAILLYSTSPNESSLSESAKIAIGVTIPVVALLLAIAGILFCFKRRRRRRAMAVSIKSASELKRQAPTSTPDTAAEGDVRGPLLAHGPVELENTDRSPPHEMPADSRFAADGKVAQPTELEDTGKMEIGYSTRALGEVPRSLQPGS